MKRKWAKPGGWPLSIVVGLVVLAVFLGGLSAVIASAPHESLAERANEACHAHRGVARVDGDAYQGSLTIICRDGTALDGQR